MMVRHIHWLAVLMLCLSGASAQNEPRITTVDHNVNGWVTNGTQVRFTLRGTAGGQAEVRLGGVPVTVPLRERARGQYDGVWTPNAQLTAPRAPVLATLTVNGQTTQAVSDRPLSIDNVPPAVTELTPADAATVPLARPDITAVVTDGAGSGVDPLSLQVTVDQDEVTAVCSMVDGRLAIHLPADLDRGRHTIAVQVSDQAGNDTQARWTITTDPPQSGPSDIQVESDGWLAAGETVKIQAAGPTRAVATFSLPGVADEIAMREVRAGMYAGSWQAPANRGITASNVPIVLRFRVGAQDTVAQAQQTLSIDTEAPTIDVRHPNQGGQVNDPQPVFLAVWSDAAGSGVDPATAVWRVDDKPIDPGAVVANGNSFYWKPTAPMNAGAHFARLQVKDAAGNDTSLAWAFTITNTGNPIRQVLYFGPRLLRPDDVVSLEVHAAPGGKATATIGGQVRIDLAQTDPGVYSGSTKLTGRQGFKDAPITVQFVDGNGKAWESTGQQLLSTTTAPNQSTPTAPAMTKPQITSPTEGANVDSPLTISGKAAAGSEVRLKLDYTTKVLVLNVTGTLLEQTVTADAAGNWRLDDVKLDSTVTGRGTRFSLTAWMVSDKGELSEPATVNFRR